MNQDDRTILALLAESLRSRVMTDKSMDLYAAALDRIAGVEAVHATCTRCRGQAKPGQAFIVLRNGEHACPDCMAGRDEKGNCWRVPVGGFPPPEFCTDWTPRPWEEGDTV